ncbi:MAG: hypothetical protein JNK12_00090 [Acidimicrobiales bacterium]|nr:hypothetical protein [Acidimicrobiales bacterium]
MAKATHRIHKETARDAGFGSVSVLSVLAGVVCAYGTFAVVAAIAGAVTNAADIATEFRTDDWTSSGAAASAITAVVLFVAYLFGGYVAGRMARRAAILHGVAVFVTTLVIGAIAGAVVTGIADNAELEQNLRSIGIPTSSDQVTGVAIAGVIVSLVAILLGSLVGSWLGEHWHTKLARRAVDPAYGPQAEAWDQAAAAEVAAQRRLEHDPALQRDAAVARAEADHRTGAPRRDEEHLDLRDRAASPSDERLTAAEWAEHQRAEHAAGRTTF